MKKKRKTWRWILLAVVLVVALVVFLLVRQARNATTGYAEEVVRSGDISTYYSFSGNVAIRNSQAVNAKVNATIREIYVEEDQQVSAGAALMRLSNGDIIKADIDGEITNVHVSQGDTVGIGAQLVDIVDFDDLQVLIKVDEYDVSAVTAGKEATVTIDALDMTYTSEVEHISKLIQSSGEMAMATAVSSTDTSYYEAKLSAPLDESVLPGMKVDVKILNAEEKNATLLPMTALQFDAYNKPFVYVRNSAGDIVESSISVGIQDGTMVQITEGLRVGDTVFVPQSTSLFPMMQRMR